MDDSRVRKSQYQVVPADKRPGPYQAPAATQWSKEKMANPVYYRLIKNGSFVGFKRIVTEYLPASHSRWQLSPIPHDSNETQKLSKPAMGIGTLAREKITSRRQTSKPEPVEQSETPPVPSGPEEIN